MVDRFEGSRASTSSQIQQQTPKHFSVPPTAAASAAASAAGAAVGPRRPTLRVTPSSSGQSGNSSAIFSPSASQTRRVWVRKKGASRETATSLVMESDELIDDLKSRVLLKYPTTLLQQCDPADLVLIATYSERPPPPRRVPSGSYVGTGPPNGPRSRSSSQSSQGGIPSPLSLDKKSVELAPDESIGSMLNRYFPTGMTMADALEVGAREQPASPQSMHTLQTQVTIPQQSPRLPVSSPVPPVPEVPVPMRTSSQRRSRQRSSDSSAKTSPLSAPAGGSLSGAAVSGASLPAPMKKRPYPAPSSTYAPDPAPKESDKGVLLLPRLLKVANAMAQQQLTHKEKADSGELNDADFSTAPESSTAPVDVEAKIVRLQHLSASRDGNGMVIVPQINVLIVEDNVINQKILEAFMRKKKVRYGVAKNGRDARDKWRRGGYHLILMDIQLPVMTGLEATKDIRRLEVANGIGAFPSSYKQQAQAPPPEEDRLDKSHGGFRSPVIIVALTASSDSEDKSEALAAGCNDFLTKPVNLMWLEQKIIEWGCMQALIDFDGWKQWLRSDPEPPQETPALKSKASSVSAELSPSSSVVRTPSNSGLASESVSHAATPTNIGTPIFDDKEITPEISSGPNGSTQGETNSENYKSHEGPTNPDYLSPRGQQQPIYQNQVQSQAGQA